MNGPALIFVLRWLVRDTFRQAFAGKVFWIMLGLTILSVVFCLGVDIQPGVERDADGFWYSKRTGLPLTDGSEEPGKLSLLFGVMRVDITRGGEQEVHLIRLILGTWVAGTAGLLFCLVWTAGFLPDFLQPAASSVMLAKPVPRWVLVLGKYVGVVAFVAVQAGLFFLLTWVALGFRTGSWQGGYLWGGPLLVLQFAGLYAFSVLVGTCTRSTVACLLGVVAFWGVCLGLNYGRHAAVALPVLAPGSEMPPVSLVLIETGYWLLPKPADWLVLLEAGLGAEGTKTTLGSLPEFEAVRQLGRFDPFLSVASVVVFIVLMLWLAGYQLARTEY